VIVLCRLISSGFVAPGTGEIGGAGTEESAAESSTGCPVPAVCMLLRTSLIKSISTAELECVCAEPDGTPMIPVGRSDVEELDGRRRRNGRRAGFSKNSARSTCVRSSSRSGGLESPRLGSRERFLGGLGGGEDESGGNGCGGWEGEVAYVEMAGVDADGPSRCSEVGLLPLLVLLMYSAIASASLSLMRFATGDIAGVEGVDGVTRVVAGPSLEFEDNGGAGMEASLVVDELAEVSRGRAEL